MRYGENPHQGASYYNEEFMRAGSLSKAKQLWGKELSYNNINDANGALELVKEFSEPCVVASKHANPCGVGVGKTIHEAYLKAYESDPVSVFGGILAINGIVDKETAEEIHKIFIEIVIAEGYTEEALAILETKKNIRLLELPDIRARREKDAYDMKKVYGGLLVQDYDETPLRRSGRESGHQARADGGGNAGAALQLESGEIHQVQRDRHRVWRTARRASAWGRPTASGRRSRRSNTRGTRRRARSWRRTPSSPSPIAWRSASRRASRRSFSRAEAFAISSRLTPVTKPESP